ncbi:MAG: GNAT family N-acetyltransferase [Burkholderiales bacterium]|nr:GNAT family N-acetyltransferase [Burkholderiales bacterium]
MAPTRDYDISTDPARFDLDAIHDFLTQSYWSPGIPRETVARAAANSLSFGVFHHGKQVGFARMVTDRATFAYLADVYVLEAHRGKGVSKKLMAYIIAHPDLQGLRRMMLATRDAHGLYARYGFTSVGAPDRLMEKLVPDVYQRATPGATKA